MTEVLNIQKKKAQNPEKEFIDSLNKLNQSIKEHYSISKSNLMATHDFIGSFLKEWETIQNEISEILKNVEIEGFDTLTDKINLVQNFMGHLLENSNSNIQNLNLFFEDAKKIFSSLRMQRKEMVLNQQRMPKGNMSRSNISSQKNQKLLLYLNKLKSYNEIIGKFSPKAKANFIQLQNAIIMLVQNSCRNSSTERSSKNEYSSSYAGYLTEGNNETKNLNNLKNNNVTEAMILKRKINELTVILNKNKDFINNLKMNIAQKTQILKMKENEINNLKNQGSLNELAEENSMLQKENMQLRAMINNNNVGNLTLNDENMRDNYKKELVAKDNMINKLKKDLNENRLLLNQYKFKINNDNQKVNPKEKVNVLNMKLINLERENEQYKKEFQILQQKLKNNMGGNKTNDELELVKKENKNLEYNINKLKQEKLELMKKLEGQNLGDTNDGGENETLKKELEKEKAENEENKNQIKILQKENNSIKNQLERLSIEMPKELNALKTQLDEANKTIAIFNQNGKNPKKGIDFTNTITKLNKQIADLKKENKELLFKLEDKEVKSAFSGYKTDDNNNKSNYEEEFDLRKMAIGAKDKNRSEDLIIDYPGIQVVKDKLKETDFKLGILREQVKILIANISFNQKIKPQIFQICQLLGYNETLRENIWNSSVKERKKILGIK